MIKFRIEILWSNNIVETFDNDSDFIDADDIGFKLTSMAWYKIYPIEITLYQKINDGHGTLEFITIWKTDIIKPSERTAKIIKRHQCFCCGHEINESDVNIYSNFVKCSKCGRDNYYMFKLSGNISEPDKDILTWEFIDR